MALLPAALHEVGSADAICGTMFDFLLEVKQVRHPGRAGLHAQAGLA